jgi:hypothetical protein
VQAFLKLFLENYIPLFYNHPPHHSNSQDENEIKNDEYLFVWFIYYFPNQLQNEISIKAVKQTMKTFFLSFLFIAGCNSQQINSDSHKAVGNGQWTIGNRQ